MTVSRNIAGTAAAFGAALMSQYVVPDIQAEEIDLSFTPEFISYNPNFPEAVAINEIALIFRQWNDAVGKTMYASSLSSINVVKSGELISTETFSGVFEYNFPATQEATVFVGFRSAGNVGWFKIDFANGLGFPITYLEGRYGNEGESLVVGGGPILLGDVNCDGVVDFLDIQPFVDLLDGGEYSDKADMNQDGEVDFLDIQPFVDALDN